MSNTRRWIHEARLDAVTAAATGIIALSLAMVACTSPDELQADLLADQRATQPAPPRGRHSPAGGLAPGAEAPDFELPLLVYEQADGGEPVAGLSEETVTLSSFRGRKLVCVFFSSYT